MKSSFDLLLGPGVRNAYFWRYLDYRDNLDVPNFIKQGIQLLWPPFQFKMFHFSSCHKNPIRNHKYCICFSNCLAGSVIFHFARILGAANFMFCKLGVEEKRLQLRSVWLMPTPGMPVSGVQEKAAELVAFVQFTKRIIPRLLGHLPVAHYLSTDERCIKPFYDQRLATS